MERDSQPFCDDCLVQLTVKHILVECPSLRELRHRHLSAGCDEDGNFLLMKILGEEADEEGLFKFIEEAGLLNKL